MKKVRTAFGEVKQYKLPNNAVDITTDVILILVSLSGYTLSVYPKLSSVYGGGRMQKAMFVVKSDQVAQLYNIGIKDISTNRTIGPLEIVFEAADYFVISPPKELEPQKHIKSIRLKKDTFDAILYVDNKYVSPSPTPTTTSSPSPISRPVATPTPITTPLAEASSQIKKPTPQLK